jgi:hypothetical protein
LAAAGPQLAAAPLLGIGKPRKRIPISSQRAYSEGGIVAPASIGLNLCAELRIGAATTRSRPFAEINVTLMGRGGSTPCGRSSGRADIGPAARGEEDHFECLQPKRCPNTVTLMMVVDKSPDITVNSGMRFESVNV